MQLNEAKERIAALVEAINRNDRLYYVEAQPVIPDAEYDAMYEELLALEKEYPQFKDPNSPTLRVSGAPLEGFAQVRHEPPMKSLDKCYEKGDLVAFDAFLRRELPADAKWRYVVEPKIDGVSMSLLYENRRLARAATRGNGETGGDNETGNGDTQNEGNTTGGNGNATGNDTAGGNDSQTGATTGNETTGGNGNDSRTGNGGVTGNGDTQTGNGNDTETAGSGNGTGSTGTAADSALLAALGLDSLSETELANVKAVTLVGTTNLSGQFDLYNAAATPDITCFYGNSILEESPSHATMRYGFDLFDTDASMTVTPGTLSDLSELALLPNLEVLILDGQNISDITPILSLTNLRVLSLNCNPLGSIAGIEAL